MGPAKRVVLPYALAIVATAAAVALRVALRPLLGDNTLHFTTLFATVMLVGLFAGTGPALVSLVLGAIAAWHFILPPVYSFKSLDSQTAIALAVYLLISCIYLVIVGEVQRSQRHWKRDADALRVSETRLSEVLASISDVFMTFDAEWRITFINDPGLKRFNKRREDVLGKSLWKLFPDAVGNEAHVQLHRAMKTRQPVEYEVYYAGWARWFFDRAYPTPDGGLTVYSADITQRKEAAEQLRRSAELLTFLIDRSPMGFYIVDADFRISHVNADSQARAFRNVNPAIGRRFDEVMRILWPEPLATEIIGIFRHTLDTGEPYKSPGLVSERADLESVETYEWQLQRVTMPDGRYAVVCYFYDTTDLREAEREVRRALDEVEHASRMKDEFLATLSHELRTPMSAILGWSQVLCRSDKLDHVRRGIVVIERNARLQAQIIEDLLDMNRIIAGKLRLEIQSVQIGTIVEAAIESIKPAAQAKNVVIELACEPQLPQIRCDSNRLQQVIYNLLSNAVKFTPEQGKVQVACRRVDSEIQISVSDTGKGIATEFLPFVFERFRQQDASTTRRFGGLGLGLSIVKRIVEMHGGTVQVASDGDGKGSIFTVHLPISLALQPQFPEGALERAQAAVARDMRNATDPNTIDTSALRGRTILVVDDERDARELIGQVLGDRGASCVLASSGEEAMGMLALGFPGADGRPHLIISDLGMPGMDGFDLMARVRSLPPDKGGAVPGIALTAFARPEDRDRCLRAGFQVHLAKPVEISELLSSVTSLIG